MGQKSAEAIVDKESTTHGSVVAGNEPGCTGMDSPCRRAELEEKDVILHELPEHFYPTGYVHGARHKNSAPQDNRSYCRLFKELRLSLTGYGPSLFGNRRMRTRMYGGVEAGGEKPPAIRLGIALIL